MFDKVLNTSLMSGLNLRRDFPSRIKNDIFILTYFDEVASSYRCGYIGLAKYLAKYFIELNNNFLM